MFYVRLRGLPWNTNEEAIETFFELKIGTKNIHIIKSADGRDSGEAVVRVNTEKEKLVLLSKHKQYMGRRYVEIFEASVNEWDRATGKNQTTTSRFHADCEVILLRGLPYSTTEEDIRQFFGSQINILGVHLTKDHLGRASGQAYCELKASKDLELAMKKDKEYIKNRYIEIFQSTTGDLAKALSRPHQQYSKSRDVNQRYNNYYQQRGAGMGGRKYMKAPGRVMESVLSPRETDLFFGRETEMESHCLRMRGLPYNTTEDAIMKFFDEARAMPQRIHKKADGSEAYVEFRTLLEKERALKKNKCFIGARYIELIDCKYDEVVQRVGLPTPYHQMAPQPYYPSSYTMREIGRGGSGSGPGAHAAYHYAGYHGGYPTSMRSKYNYNF